VGASHLTLMRTPVVKRHPFPKSGFFPFFSAGEFPASCASGNVFWLGFSRLVQRAWGCTTHFLRVARHRDGECREPCAGSWRPSNSAVPSYRPRLKQGDRSLCASAAQGRGKGSTPSPSVTFALGTGAGVQAKAQGQGTAPLGSGAFSDARCLPEHGGQAAPMVPQGGRRLTCSPP
jgi:hypothetical protein